MAMARACPISWIEIRKGQSRLVLLVGSVALKIPHIKRKSELSRCGQVRQGLRCNRAERAAWVRDGKRYPNLCPILASLPGGWLVVMQRATPMTRAEFDEWHDSEDWPHFPGEDGPYELKHQDAGKLPFGKRVMVDYGANGY